MTLPLLTILDLISYPLIHIRDRLLVLIQSVHYSNPLMALSRSILIERLLHDKSSDEGPSSDPIPSTSHGIASWDDIEAFERDTFNEVESKLNQLDNLIWGKVIVMEKNTRTAKAYLRCGSMKIDSSRWEFDGSRFGIRRYGNPRRDENGEKILNGLTEGISLRVDTNGDVWIQSQCTIWISRGMKSKRIEKGDEAKLFDLRSFKSSLLDRNSDGDQRKELLSKSIVYIKCTPSPALSCPLWFCLIHLISVELTTMLHPLSSTGHSSPSSSTRVSTRSSYSPSSSHSENTTPPPPPILKNSPLSSKGPSTVSSILRSTTSITTSHERPLAKLTLPQVRLPSSSSSPSTSHSSHRSSNQSGSDRLLISTRERVPERRREMSHDRLMDRMRNMNIEVSNPKQRGGVKKRLDRTNMNGFEAKPAGLVSQMSRLSSSVIDLRSLDNLRRPAYFCQGFGTRGGGGHILARIHS